MYFHVLIGPQNVPSGVAAPGAAHVPTLSDPVGPAETPPDDIPIQACPVPHGMLGLKLLAASTPVHDVPAEPTPSDQGVDQANEICVPNCWLLQTCPRAIWAAWSHRGCVSLTQAVMLTSVPPTVSEGRHTKSAVPPGKLMLPADTVTAPPTVGVTGLVPPSLRAVPAALATMLFSGKPSPEAPISVNCGGGYGGIGGARLEARPEIWAADSRRE